MDDFDFGFDSVELTGNGFHFSFDAKGRLSQLWMGDGNGNDLPFIGPPVPMGDESSEDYLPGTILISARTDPEEPWIGSRNTSAKISSNERAIEIEYEFSLLPEFRVTGQFFERPDRPGTILWEITIQNRSRQSIELGEFAFPFALYNSLDGVAIGDEGMNTLLTERMVLHQNIGGAASFISARRICGDPPGLVIYPGADSPWEFGHHSPQSLGTSSGWTGVPMVYIHSAATTDREDWGNWMFNHSSLVLEPKEERTFQVCFSPILPRHQGDPILALADYGCPVFRPAPSGVVPCNSALYLETAGTRVARLEVSEEDCEIETESDEHGGLSILRKSTPGPVRVLLEDMNGREGWCDVFFTPLLQELIIARAEWIMKHQVMTEGPFIHGILPADPDSGTVLEKPFMSIWGLISSIADATFLAEKNKVYPDLEQIATLDRYVEQFLLKKFHKAAQGTVAVYCPDWENAVAMDASRPQVYAFLAKLYTALMDLAGVQDAAADLLSRDEEGYRQLIESLCKGITQFADRDSSIAQPLYGGLHLFESEIWEKWRDGFLDLYRLPFWVGKDFSVTTFEEVAEIAIRDRVINASGSVEQILSTLKSPSPAWWSFGSEARPLTEYSSHPSLSDFGAIFPSFTSVSSSRVMTNWLERDYSSPDELTMRLAFAGLMTPWALIRSDGAQSMGFCPDLGSLNRGVVRNTGDLGFALADYLRNATCYLIANPERGFISHGTNFETYSNQGRTVFRLEPWDGVGRRFVIRHLNVIIECRGGKIDLLELDMGLKWMKIAIDLPNESIPRQIQITVDGLWGTKFEVEGAEHTFDGVLTLKTEHEGVRLKEIEVKVLD